MKTIAAKFLTARRNNRAERFLREHGGTWHDNSAILEFFDGSCVVVTGRASGFEPAAVASLREAREMRALVAKRSTTGSSVYH